ncbi:MAG TPA: gas vesicle protein GvpG [Thermoguttaceae bacterium]|nr:gas vesicle protein GvpG [Thermoguttaceae bacterium]
MLIIDDILFAPFKGFVAVCRHVEEAARQDLENQKSEIIVALAELHQQLESGRIDEAEFDARETKLLERLEGIERTLNPDDQTK